MGTNILIENGYIYNSSSSKYWRKCVCAIFTQTLASATGLLPLLDAINLVTCEWVLQKCQMPVETLVIVQSEQKAFFVIKNDNKSKRSFV